MSSVQVYSLKIGNGYHEQSEKTIKNVIYTVLHETLEKLSISEGLDRDEVVSIQEKIDVTKNSQNNDEYNVTIPLFLLPKNHESNVIEMIHVRFKEIGYSIDNVKKISSVLTEENIFSDKYCISHSEGKMCEECLCGKECCSSKQEFDKDVEKVADDNNEYVVKALINGITCSACTSTINNVCKELWYVKSSEINFITKIGIFTLKSNDMSVIDDLKDNIEDCGYDFELMEEPTLINNNSEENTQTGNTVFQLSAAIDGIYCAACVHTIENAIENEPKLSDVVINAEINPITKIGNFMLKNYNDDVKNLLTETIEDCGYDFDIIDEVQNVEQNSLKTKLFRTVNLKIENMYCDQCPLRIEQALKSKIDVPDTEMKLKWNESQVSKSRQNSNKNLVKKHEILKIIYKPSLTNGLNIRNFIEIIDSIDSKITVNVAEKESLQDHMNKIASKELKNIAIRLMISLLFAIPSFIFGILVMSLLSKNNSLKQKMEAKTIGNASILMWILFAVSTPVYFGVNLIFHKKAFKEIRVLWKMNILFDQHNGRSSFLSGFNWKAFFKRFVKFGSMNMLISLGTSVAYFASVAMVILSTKQKPGDEMYETYFDSVVFLTFFLLIGKFLENYSKKKTVGMLNNLSAISGDSTVTIIDQVNSKITDIKYVKIPKNQLEINDIMLIKPGESPLVDGILLVPLQQDSEFNKETVITQFDESSLTGESMPCNKVVGDSIYAGTINLTFPIHSQIKDIDNLSKGSLLDKILESITMGQLNKRASLEKTADSLTSFFVPAICFISLVVWFIWLGLGYSHKLPISYICKKEDLLRCSENWSLFSVGFSISVFVISCPCALGLAVPLSMFVGSGVLAKHGILPKGGGMALQNCSEIDIVCFDKTGTLTQGNVIVVDSIATDTEKWNILRYMEEMSNHPLSNAVVNYINKELSVSTENLDTNKIGNVKEVSGKGLITDKGYIVGNEKFLIENNYKFDTDMLDVFLKWKMKGYSIVVFGFNRRVLISLALADTLREETKFVINQLQSKGIEVYMLSGDNPITARAIGEQLVMDNVDKYVKGGLLPEDKADMVKKLRNDGEKTVVMVGDGINDAPALSNATVGVAISTSKTANENKTSDLALLSCDFAILQRVNPLLSVLTLFEVSKVTLRRVYLNLGWALLYNIIGIPIAAGILYKPLRFKLSPTWSAFAMAASSVSVVVSSTLLKFYKPVDYAKKMNDDK
ncbi:hypothetical protein FOG50_00368 [Hanseniaspora uvarum]|nr:hypothetical protein FOG50_00368 [Hanseniaspora uvarum]